MSVPRKKSARPSALGASSEGRGVERTRRAVTPMVGAASHAAPLAVAALALLGCGGTTEPVEGPVSGHDCARPGFIAALHPRRIHAGPQALSAAVAGVEHRDPEQPVRCPPARYTTQPHPGSPRGKLSTRRRLREPIRRAERERVTRRKRVPCAERAEVPVAWSAVRASVRKALFPNRTADSAAKRRVPFPSPRRCGGERPGEVCRGRVRSAEAG